MFGRSLSLAMQLVLTFVGLVVITTTVLTISASRSVRLNLSNEARQTVRGSAQQVARNLTRLIEQQHDRAQGFLSAVDSLCGETAPSGRRAWEPGCVRVALAEFRATEHMRGARLEHRAGLTRVGEPLGAGLALPWPLARIVPHPPGFDYLLMATNGRATLTVLYSADQLDSLFRDHAVLGSAGEVFLIDSDGRFLTTVRHSEFGLPTHVEPIGECLRGVTDWTGIDYRGINSFHGLSPVPIFFGGACVDAHLAYDEALAPVDALRNRLAARGLIFAFVGMVLSLIAARWISRPVRRLAMSARALGDGDFNRPIPVTGPSEIRALGRGFANMARALSDLALHDALTNLPNRRLLDERLTQAIAMSTRYSGRVAVFFLDLDRFKHVNDSLGHEVGDHLLQSVAARLLACVRASDTVSRQGGDEFVLVLPDIESPSAAARTAEKILASLGEPHDLQGHRLQVHASIGISLYPDDGEDAETLLKQADTAMYHAKEDGRNTYRFFAPEMSGQSIARRRAGNLRRLLARYSEGSDAVGYRRHH